MNTINIPGFTAETSVYTSAVCYRSMPAVPQGAGIAVISTQFGCFRPSQCSACIPLGPSIFSPGHQFCIDYSCRYTPSGGCVCRQSSKGFRPCQPPVPEVLTTAV
jgi:hypothetical protein